MIDGCCIRTLKRLPVPPQAQPGFFQSLPAVATRAWRGNVRHLTGSRPASRALSTFCLLLAGFTASAEDTVGQLIAQRIDEFAANDRLQLQGEPLLARSVLVPFYRKRDFAPAWKDPARIDELLLLLDAADTHGLEPRDYLVETLRALRGQPATAALTADLDLLLTEALVRYGYHQTFGKVNPQRMEPTWNFRRALKPGQTPSATLEAALAAPSLAVFGRDHLDRSVIYRRLQQALARHRLLAEQGGWPAVDPGPTLRPGERDARVAGLRQRLLAGPGLTPEAATDPELFDESLADAVRSFQRRHGLDADGIVGAQTLAALNVPVESRIDQLRLSLERFRWVKDEAIGSYLLVNIAGPEIFLVQDNRITWRRRAVVGRLLRQTPIFRGSMTYLEINPTWTVPPTILREDILPRVRRDPGYLAAENITLLDRDGRRVDPYSVDWPSLRAVPYTFRQEPGPRNALGQIKFMFPNEHFVFIHDTPSRELFRRADRLISSGCIRIEDPLSLAEILLGNPARWNQQSLQAAIATGRTQQLRLPEPWPVLILYWTAEPDDEGGIRFLRDVYSRDARLLAALDGEVTIELPAEE
jgi:murein L,D-transpeptidase YcbB/YkuD